MQRFHQALHEATNVAEASAAAIAGSFLKVETELVAGFAAIGAAVVGMVDKVGMADQSYRLFALHMYMSKDAARGLKVAMDALGEPLENLTWDKELRDRTRQLIEDQRAMAPDGDYESQMRKIRDIRFQFTRMEVEGQYLAMNVVTGFMKALGLGPDELLGKLEKFNDWVTRNLPAITDKIVTLFMPVWKDVVHIMKDAWQVGLDFAQVFTNIVGVLSGDKALQGTITLEKFAGSIEKCVHWLGLVADALVKITGLLSGVLVGGTVGGLLGTVIGGVAGIPGGPAGIAAGALGGGALGTSIGAGIGGVSGGAFDLYRAYHPATPPNLPGADGSNAVHGLIDKYAESMGVNAALAHAVAMQESGERQYGADGKLITSSSGAIGAMQLTRGTANALGVDRNDTEANVKGGVALLGHLMKQYGDAATAVAAYHEGEPKMDAILAGRATLSPEARGEVASVMARMGAKGSVQVGSIVINITKPNATNEDVGNVVAARIQGLQDKRVQRNLAEFQDLSWSY